MNVDKGGFSQTLYNIFSFCDPKNLLFITSHQSFINGTTSQPYTSRTITYNTEFLSIQRNRSGKYLNKTISWLNYSISSYLKSFKKIKEAIRNFNADVVVVAPNSAEGVFYLSSIRIIFQKQKSFSLFYG